MTFELKPVERATFDANWTPGVRAQLDEFIYRYEQWDNWMGQRNWVMDKSTQTTVTHVRMANKFDAAECYALVQQGEFALIRNVGWGTYTIAAFSQGFSQRIDEVKELAAKALLLGGRQLDGNPGPDSDDFLRSIPYVNFVDYVAPKIGE